MALIRVCDVCGQFDDHPRHVFADATDSFPLNEDHLNAALAAEGITVEERAFLVKQIMDTTEQARHMDCCREVGCPTGDCNNVPHLKGDDLRAAIVGGSE